MFDSAALQKLAATILSGFVLLTGCRSSDDFVLDQELDYWLKYHGVRAQDLRDISAKATDIYSQEAKLGKLLFFSTSLSGNDEVACVTCHHPMLGGDDDLPLPVGVDAVDRNVVGVGRVGEGKPMVPRNSPTTFNSLLWQRSLFFDGRIERLDHELSEHAVVGISTPDVRYGDVDLTVDSLIHAQAGFPVTSEHEMRASFNATSSNQRIRNQLVANLVDDVQADRASSVDKISWDTLFLQVYPEDKNRELPELLSFERVRSLLAHYEASQVFVDSPWQRYLEGEVEALSDSAKQGAITFFATVEQGGAGCAGCHNGPILSDEEFHVLAVPHAGIGKDINEEDTGRFLRTGVFDDRYAFRTPSLLNVEHTAPYGHSGVFPSLESIIRHHLDPEESIRQFDFAGLDKQQSGLAHPRGEAFSHNALAVLQAQRDKGLSKLPYVQLDDDQIDSLISFLGALTDPCLESESCLAPWLPQPRVPNPGGSLIEPKISRSPG